VLNEEKILLVLNTLSVILIVFFLDNFVLKITLLLILLIFTIQKTWTRIKLNKTIQNQKDVISLTSNRLSELRENIGKTRKDIDQQLFLFENKIDNVRSDFEVDMNNQYRDLTRKIIELENRLNQTKKTLGAGLGLMEERLKEREE
jgi:peptidoglycan hydrolase CwlO-like protein